MDALNMKWTFPTYEILYFYKNEKHGYHMSFIKTMSYYTNASEWLEISRMTSTSFETHASTQGGCDGMGLEGPAYSY